MRILRQIPRGWLGVVGPPLAWLFSAIVSLVPFALAFVVWLMAVQYLKHRMTRISSFGQFGDSFGALNALCSALAAVAAFKAYWSQRQQLNNQQAEFRIQRHESHLFFLMEELRQAVRGVTIVDMITQPDGRVREGELMGQRAICHLENVLLGKLYTRNSDVELSRESTAIDRHVYFIAKERFALWDGIIDQAPPASGPDAKLQPQQKKQWIPSQAKLNPELRLNRQVINAAFNQFYEERAGAALGNVFRLQAAILRYIDNQSIPEPQREQHAKLFKAQITDPELHLLLYYALSDLAGDEDSAADNSLRQIMMRYKILEALKRKKPEFIWHRIPEISYFEDTNTSPG